MHRYIKVQGYETACCLEIDVDKIADSIEINHILSTQLNSNRFYCHIYNIFVQDKRFNCDMRQRGVKNPMN